MFGVVLKSAFRHSSIEGTLHLFSVLRNQNSRVEGTHHTAMEEDIDKSNGLQGLSCAVREGV